MCNGGNHPWADHPPLYGTGNSLGARGASRSADWWSSAWGRSSPTAAWTHRCTLGISTVTTWHEWKQYFQFSHLLKSKEKCVDKPPLSNDCAGDMEIQSVGRKLRLNVQTQFTTMIQAHAAQQNELPLFRESQVILIIFHPLTHLDTDIFNRLRIVRRNSLLLVPLSMCGSMSKVSLPGSMLLFL